MPRCKEISNTFVAGALPIVMIKDNSYYVDGRLQQLRNVNDFMEVIDCVDDDIWELLSQSDRVTICYEFMGVTI